MHIAMLSGEYPPRWGGIGTVVHHLARALADRGHEVSVITRNSRATKIDPSLIPSQKGVEVIEVGWIPLPMAFTRSYGKRAMKELVNLHKRKPVDIVHLLCPLIAWKKKQFDFVKSEIAPIIAVMNGTWIGERDGLKFAAKYSETAVWKNPNDLAIRLTAKHYAKYEQIAITEANLTVSISESCKKEIEESYNPPKNWRNEVILYGVDEKQFFPLHNDWEEAQLHHEETRQKYGTPDEAALAGDVNTETPLLLAVGRLVARKGFQTLIRAMPLILKELPNSHLVIVGRGHMAKTLKKQVKKMGIQDKITIEAGVPFEELTQLYRSSDLVIYPSYYEGQGLVPLEAMASGTSIVTVNHGPLPEMVDIEVGNTFTAGDEKELAKVVINELKNFENRKEKIKIGRKRILDKYTYAHNAISYELLYNELKKNEL